MPRDPGARTTKGVRGRHVTPRNRGEATGLSLDGGEEERREPRAPQLSHEERGESGRRPGLRGGERAPPASETEAGADAQPPESKEVRGGRMTPRNGPGRENERPQPDGEERRERMEEGQSYGGGGRAPRPARLASSPKENDAVLTPQTQRGAPGRGRSGPRTNRTR